MYWNSPHLFTWFYFFIQQILNNNKKIWQLEHDEKACTKGIISEVKSHEAKNKKKVTKFTLRDETGFLNVVFFNQDYLTKVFKKGDSVIVYGKIKREGGFLEIACPVAYADF